MNKKLILTALLSILLLACSRPSETPAKNSMMPPPQPNPAGCSGPILTLTLNLNSIKLAPATPKCMVPGKTYTMNILTPGNKVAISKGSVTTKMNPKNGTTPPTTHWLNQSNSADKNKLVITVPTTEMDGAEYSYDLAITGHGFLDPKVKVVGELEYKKAIEWDLKHYQPGDLDLLATDP